MIAYGADGWHAGETGGFLKRAGNHLDGLAIKLEWADDAVSGVTLWGEQGEDSKVRYLSQKFVERLCAEDELGAELVQEIEAVIFSHLDPSETMNASSFDELRTLRTEGVADEGDRLRSDINRLIREECALFDNHNKLEEKKARIRALTKEREGLQKQIPVAASPEEEANQRELLSKRQDLTGAQHAAAHDKQKLQKISDIRGRVSGFTS